MFFSFLYTYKKFKQSIDYQFGYNLRKELNSQVENKNKVKVKPIKKKKGITHICVLFGKRQKEKEKVVISFLSFRKKGKGKSDRVLHFI